MHMRDSFFSPQGGRSPYIKNRAKRQHLCSQGAYIGPGMDCLVISLLGPRVLA
nr:unnamed protein product [Callosobruchus chinensis]